MSGATAPAADKNTTSSVTMRPANTLTSPPPSQGVTEMQQIARTEVRMLTASFVAPVVWLGRRPAAVAVAAAGVAAAAAHLVHHPLLRPVVNCNFTSAG